MKLRNKKTGEIGYLQFDDVVQRIRVVNANNDTVGEYKSLADLNEEWEDYEDELFYIVSAEHKDGYICALKEDYKELCDVAKKLGIGFETEKEAKKAVEKLKAWKRLKDKGFRFIGCAIPSDKGMSICYETDIENWTMQDLQDFKTLFGVEE